MNASKTVEMMFSERRFPMMTTRPIGQISSRSRVVLMLVATCAVALTCGVGTSATASAAGDTRTPTLQGFTPDLSVSRGQTVHFKIETDAPAYSITIYLLDDTGVAGTKPVASLPNPPAPQVQPPCLPNQDAGLLDCSNWSESASWTVPANTVPGLYIALLQRSDTNASGQIVFVVQDDVNN
jgi:hypothetical protein